MCHLRYFRQTNQLTLTFVLRERDLSLPTLLLKEEISLYKKLWDSFVYGEKVDKSDKMMFLSGITREGLPSLALIVRGSKRPQSLA